MGSNLKALVAALEAIDSNELTLSVTESEQKLREAVVEFVNQHNENLAPERQVSITAALTVVDRHIQENLSAEDPREWMFFAAREVAHFVDYAAGIQASAAPRHQDLLPVGHPDSQNPALKGMSAPYQRVTRGRWFAADPRVAQEARTAVYEAYATVPGTPENMFALARLDAMTAGAVPAELIIKPLVAAFGVGNPFAGNNSSMARSARAKLQRRDRKGRFAEMGGGARFFANLKGAFKSITGKFAGNPVDSNDLEVEVLSNSDLPDGIYSIPASRVEGLKAVLNLKPGAGKEGLVDTRNQKLALSEADLLASRKDAPTGWTSNGDGTFTSDDGYTVTPGTPENAKDANFIGSGTNGAYDENRPVLDVKDADGNTVAFVQDWANVQKAAAQNDVKAAPRVRARLIDGGYNKRGPEAGDRPKPDQRVIDRAMKQLDDIAETARKNAKGFPNRGGQWNRPEPEVWDGVGFDQAAGEGETNPEAWRAEANKQKQEDMFGRQLGKQERMALVPTSDEIAEAGRDFSKLNALQKRIDELNKAQGGLGSEDTYVDPSFAQKQLDAAFAKVGVIRKGSEADIARKKRIAEQLTPTPERKAADVDGFYDRLDEFAVAIRDGENVEGEDGSELSVWIPENDSYGRDADTYDAEWAIYDKDGNLVADGKLFDVAYNYNDDDIKLEVKDALDEHFDRKIAGELDDEGFNQAAGDDYQIFDHVSDDGKIKLNTNWEREVEDDRFVVYQTADGEINGEYYPNLPVKGKDESMEDYAKRPEIAAILEGGRQGRRKYQIEQRQAQEARMEAARAEYNKPENVAKRAEEAAAKKKAQDELDAARRSVDTDGLYDRIDEFADAIENGKGEIKDAEGNDVLYGGWNADYEDDETVNFEIFDGEGNSIAYDGNVHIDDLKAEIRAALDAHYDKKLKDAGKDEGFNQAAGDEDIFDGEADEEYKAVSDDLDFILEEADGNGEASDELTNAVEELRDAAYTADGRGAARVAFNFPSLNPYKEVLEKIAEKIQDNEDALNARRAGRKEEAAQARLDRFEEAMADNNLDDLEAMRADRDFEEYHDEIDDALAEINSSFYEGPEEGFDQASSNKLDIDHLTDPKNWNFNGEYVSPDGRLKLESRRIDPEWDGEAFRGGGSELTGTFDGRPIARESLEDISREVAESLVDVNPLVPVSDKKAQDRKFISDWMQEIVDNGYFDDEEGFDRAAGRGSSESKQDIAGDIQSRGSEIIARLEEDALNGETDPERIDAINQDISDMRERLDSYVSAIENGDMSSPDRTGIAPLSTNTGIDTSELEALQPEVNDRLRKSFWDTGDFGSDRPEGFDQAAGKDAVYNRLDEFVNKARDGEDIENEDGSEVFRASVDENGSAPDDSYDIDWAIFDKNGENIIAEGKLRDVARMSDEKIKDQLEMGLDDYYKSIEAEVNKALDSNDLDELLRMSKDSEYADYGQEIEDALDASRDDAEGFDQAAGPEGQDKAYFDKKLYGEIYDEVFPARQNRVRNAIAGEDLDKIKELLADDSISDDDYQELQLAHYDLTGNFTDEAFDPIFGEEGFDQAAGGKMDEPATEAQYNFIDSVLKQQGNKLPAELRDSMEEAVANKNLTKGEIGAIIGEMNKSIDKTIPSDRQLASIRRSVLAKGLDPKEAADILKRLPKMKKAEASELLDRLKGMEDTGDFRDASPDLIGNAGDFDVKFTPRADGKWDAVAINRADGEQLGQSEVVDDPAAALDEFKSLGVSDFAGQDDIEGFAQAAGNEKSLATVEDFDNLPVGSTIVSDVFGSDVTFTKKADGKWRANSSVVTDEFADRVFPNIIEQTPGYLTARLPEEGFNQEAGDNNYGTSGYAAGYGFTPEGDDATYSKTAADGTTISAVQNSGNSWSVKRFAAGDDPATAEPIETIGDYNNPDDAWSAAGEASGSEFNETAARQADLGSSATGKMAESATPAQYALLQEYADERDSGDANFDQAIQEALANKNLTKAQMGSLINGMRDKPFKPGIDPNKPSDRAVKSLTSKLLTKDLSEEEVADILDRLPSMNREEVDALNNKLRSKKDRPGTAGFAQAAGDEDYDAQESRGLTSESADEMFSSPEAAASAGAITPERIQDIADRLDASNGKTFQYDSGADLVRELNEPDTKYPDMNLYNKRNAAGSLMDAADDIRDSDPELAADMDKLAKDILAKAEADAGPLVAAQFGGSDTSDDLFEPDNLDWDDVQEEVDTMDDYFFPTDTDAIAEKLGDDGYIGDDRSGGAEGHVSDEANENGKYEARVSYGEGTSSDNERREFDTREEAIDWATSQIADYNYRFNQGNQNFEKQIADAQANGTESEFLDKIQDLADHIRNRRGNPEVARKLDDYIDNARKRLDEKNKAAGPFIPENDEGGFNQEAGTAVSPKMGEPATDAQYDYLKELGDRKSDISPELSQAIADSLEQRNLTKSQIGGLLGQLRALNDNEGFDSSKPTPRQIQRAKALADSLGLSPRERRELGLNKLSSMSPDEIQKLIDNLKRRGGNDGGSGGVKPEAPKGRGPRGGKGATPNPKAEAPRDGAEGFNQATSSTLDLPTRSVDLENEAAADKAVAETISDNKKAEAGLLSRIKQWMKGDAGRWTPNFTVDRGATRDDDRVTSSNAPINPASGHVYSAQNMYALAAAADERGYQDRRWMTAEQAIAEGGFIREGEQGVEILIPTQKRLRYVDENGDVKERTVISMEKAFVFNAEQAEGLGPDTLPETPGMSAGEALDFVLARFAEAEDKRAGRRPFKIREERGAKGPRWMPNGPYGEGIRMPDRSQFDSPAGYVQSLLHELIHSTGFRTRMGRKSNVEGLRGDRRQIALEELTAELGSAVLMQRLGIPFDEKKHAAYVNSHMSGLSEEDLNFAFMEAQAAADYALGNDVLPKWDNLTTDFTKPARGFRPLAGRSWNPDPNLTEEDAPSAYPAGTPGSESNPEVQGFAQAAYKRDSDKAVKDTRSAVDKVTEALLAALKEGQVPWRKPYKEGVQYAGANLPRNPMSRHIYTGLNAVVLAMIAQARGYEDPRWMTFNQAKNAGGSVRKGEKGTMILVPKVSYKEDEETGEKKSVVFFSTAYVFNAEQIDGLTLRPLSEEAPERMEPLDAHNFIIERYKKAMEARTGKAPEIIHDYVGAGGYQAPHWAPATDRIVLPTLEQFNSPEEMFDTLAHEMVHSTGHVDRLDRSELSRDYANADGVARAKEELIAEIGAALLADMFGIETTLDNSAAYVKSWLQRLQSHPEEIVTAAREAQKAVDYLLGTDLGDWSPLDGYGKGNAVEEDSKEKE